MNVETDETRCGAASQATLQPRQPAGFPPLPTWLGTLMLAGASAFVMVFGAGRCGAPVRAHPPSPPHSTDTAATRPSGSVDKPARL